MNPYLYDRQRVFAGSLQMRMYAVGGGTTISPNSKTFRLTAE